MGNVQSSPLPRGSSTNDFSGLCNRHLIMEVLASLLTANIELKGLIDVVETFQQLLKKIERIQNNRSSNISSTVAETSHFFDDSEVDTDPFIRGNAFPDVMTQWFGEDSEQESGEKIRRLNSWETPYNSVGDDWESEDGKSEWSVESGETDSHCMSFASHNSKTSSSADWESEDGKSGESGETDSHCMSLASQNSKTSSDSGEYRLFSSDDDLSEVESNNEADYECVQPFSSDDDSTESEDTNDYSQLLRTLIYSENVFPLNKDQVGEKLTRAPVCILWHSDYHSASKIEMPSPETIEEKEQEQEKEEVIRSRSLDSISSSSSGSSSSSDSSFSA